MCWISDKRTTAQVAMEDIPTFKLCFRDKENIIRPYHFSGKLQYEEGGIYTSKIRRFKNARGEHEIDNGLHSYSPKCFITPFSSADISVYYRNEFLCRYSTFKLCILLCVIPKDSTFYLNEKGEYVSNKIHVVKVIDYPEEDDKFYYNYYNKEDKRIKSTSKILTKWIHKKIEL